MSADCYIFAFYVFILICVIIVLCRALFVKAKKQRVLLEEKEAKLLKLFSTVEDAMDEFYDLASESRSEIDEALRKLSSLVGSVYKAEKENRTEDMNRTKAAGADADRLKMDGKKGEPKEIAHVEPPPQPTEAFIPSRMDTILNLSHGGKTRAQIARELGITQNEVDLVIGMYKKTM